MNLFDWNKEHIKLTGKIRLFEAFAGIGAQAEALKRVTSNYELVGISETQMYKQTGNSIVVDVLEAIFRRMIE